MIPVRSYFRLLTDYLRPQRAKVALLAVVLTGVIGLQLVNPQLIKQFIDAAVEDSDASQLIPIAVAFIVIAIAQQALAIWSTYLAEDIGWTATNLLRSDITEHTIRLDMGFHKGKSPGELIERIDGDVTSLSNFFSAMMIKVVANGALIIGILVMLARESWIVGLGVAVFTLLAMAVMTGLHQVAVPWWKAVRATSAETYGFVGEVVEGTEDITANGAAPYMNERFDDLHRKWLPQTVRAWMGWGIMWSTNVVLYGLSLTLVFALGAWLFGIGTLTIGSVYLVFHYTEMTRYPMDQIRNQLEDLQKASAASTGSPSYWRRGLSSSLKATRPSPTDPSASSSIESTSPTRTVTATRKRSFSTMSASISLPAGSWVCLGGPAAASPPSLDSSPGSTNHRAGR